MPRNFGIDLGTTNTVVCCFESLSMIGFSRLNEIQIRYPEEISHGYYNIDNGLSLPSLLYLEEDPGEPGTYVHYVGEVAERLSELSNNVQENLFINTKRLMSKKDDLGFGIRACDVARDLYNVCFYSINSEMKRNIPATQEFCVTRPAAYNPFATVATIDVAKEFGYKNVRSIEEPEAALLNYLYELLENTESEKELLKRQEENEGHLVFGIIDIGGGTTDVKIQRFSIEGCREIEGDEFATGYIVTFNNEEIEGKQSKSNPYEAFGGLDFDREAAKYILQKIDIELKKRNQLPISQLISQNQQLSLQAKAMHEAKKFKEQMNGNHVGIWDVPAEYFNLSDRIRIEWNEEEYNRWVAPLCKSENMQDYFDIQKLTIYSIIENTLKRSNYKIEDLDCFFVTGGMSNYKPIRDMLMKEYSDKIKIKFSNTPLKDIARGAALYNAYFQIKVPLITLNEGIMIDNPCGEPVMLVPSGHKLPYSGDIENKIVITNPVEMRIDILSGLNTFDSNMRLIKRLWARKLEPARVGTPVDIHFEITEEFRISLSFHVRQSENSYEIPIDAEDYDIKVK